MRFWSRHAAVIIRDKLRRLFEPALDPERVTRIFREFDEDRGYRDYHDYCRTKLSRPLEATKPCELVDRGFQLVKAIDPLDAMDIQTNATARPETYLKRDSRKLKGFQIGSAQIEALLARVLSADVDRLALRYFGSEYLVHWFTLARTAPSDQPSVSFKWHCDRGPSEHLKLLLYLNDTTEHGGGTAFVHLNDTAHVARSGYLFARGRKRTGDIEELARLAGRELRVHQPRITAGTGVMFQPTKVLHCGIAPTLAPRYVLTLCLLPSPVPWLTALRADTLTDLNQSALWHTNARELLRKMS